MGRERGQPAVLGIVLLIGFVLVSAAALLIVGSAALSSVQEQSEREHDVTEMKSISHEIETMVRSAGGETSIDVQDGYQVSDGATVSVLVDGRPYGTYKTGRLERSELVYEGGMILEDGHVIGSPTLDVERDSVMLSIPRLATDEFDGSIRHRETETIPADPGSRVELEIQSDYYEQWYHEFEGLDPTKDNDNETVRVSLGAVAEPGEVVEHGFAMGSGDASGNQIQLASFAHFKADSYDSSLGKYDPATNSGSEITISSQKRVHLTAGGNDAVIVDGTLQSTEDVQETSAGNYDIETRREYVDIDEPMETDAFMPDDPTAWKPFDPTTESTLSDGDYYVAGDLLLGDDLEINGDVSLYVDGDLQTKGHDIDVDGSLSLYVANNVFFQDGSDLTNVNRAHDPTDIRLFANGTVVRFGSGGDSSVTGVIHGTDAKLEVQSRTTVYGAIATDDLDGSNRYGELYLHYDERLASEPIDNAESDADDGRTHVDVRLPVVESGDR